MSATTDRNTVHSIAATDPERALRLARGILEPWFRCQALAFVAERESDAKARERLIREALNAAGELGEPNRVVSVSAWPLQVLNRSGDSARLAKEVERLLSVIGAEPQAVRRADAIYQLLDKLQDAPSSVFGRLMDTFQAACLAMHGKAKKKEWLMRNAVFIAASVDPQRARALANLIQRPLLRQEAFKALE